MTDLQWRLLRSIGNDASPFGYVPMLWYQLTGRPVDAPRIDQVTQSVFYLSLLASLLVNRAWLSSFI